MNEPVDYSQFKWLVYQHQRDTPLATKRLVAAFQTREEAQEYADEFIAGDFTDGLVEEWNQ